MLKLQIIYFLIAAAISLSLGVLVANVGGPVWVTGFLPPAILGLIVTGRAYRLGQESGISIAE